MKIKVHTSFIILTAFFLITDRSLLPVCILFFAFLHELAHITAAKIFGAEIREINLQPFGINMRMENTFTYSYKDEIIICMSGPFLNLAITVLLLLFKGDPLLIFFNAGIFILNILPIYPLDGGRMLYAVLCSVYDSHNAKIISDRVTLIFLIAMICAGAWILYVTQYNFSLILIGVYLLMGLLKGRI